MIYFIGDLHLDHTNIIKYCNRAFSSTDEMNRVIIQRWNDTVCKNDTVYFLGDIAYGRGSNPGWYWWEKLNGNKILIKGNHDRQIGRIYPVYRVLNVEFGGIKFTLIHSPDYLLTNDHSNWVIHGHHHNNNLELYPLINRKNKTINVSAEILDYYPISLGKILDMINSSVP